MRQLIAALVVSAFAIVAAAPVAGAHLTVDPGEAPKGGFATVAFRVPNEHQDAGTTGLEVNLPEDHRIENVSVRPKEGWTYEVERTGDGAVTTITWSGGVIRPGEFDQFEVSLGPLPEDTDQLLFPTLQTYQGGEIVRWVDEPLPGGEEPEFPAPLLRLVDAEGEVGHAVEEADDGDHESGSEQAGGVSVENLASQDDVDAAKALSIAGILVGALGLLIGGFSLLRRRRT
jgi:uncharacterized protein YcnI